MTCLGAPRQLPLTEYHAYVFIVYLVHPGTKSRTLESGSI